MHSTFNTKQERILSCLCYGERHHMKKLISSPWLSSFDGALAILNYLHKKVGNLTQYTLEEANYCTIKKYLLVHIHQLMSTKNELFKLFFPEIYFEFAPLAEIQAETALLFCFDEKEYYAYATHLVFKKKSVFQSMLTNALHLEKILEHKQNHQLTDDYYLKTMKVRRLKSRYDTATYRIFNNKHFKEQVLQLSDAEIYTFL